MRSEFQKMERAHGITWQELIDLEPDLEHLLWRASRAGALCRRWEDADRLFRPLRNELAGVLGDHGRYRRDPLLGTPGAYEVALWHLHDAMTRQLPQRITASA